MCPRRLDLGGPLMANLFRALFRKLTKDVRNYLQVGGGGGGCGEGGEWR